jgi:hypothetical protein
MFDAPMMDMTPVIQPVYLQTQYSNTAVSRHGVVDRPRQTTSPISDSRRFVQTESHTPASVDQQHPLTQRKNVRSNSTVDQSPLSKARDDRIALLVRKYEGLSSAEDSARLAILTERIRRLSPNIPAKALDLMEEMVQSAEDVSTDLADIRAQFGLG